MADLVRIKTIPLAARDFGPLGEGSGETLIVCPKCKRSGARANPHPKFLANLTDIRCPKCGFYSIDNATGEVVKRDPADPHA